MSISSISFIEFHFSLRYPFNKMKLLLVLAALVAITAACGPLQRLKVKRQWAYSYGNGIDRANFGNFVWAELVMIDLNLI